VLGLAIVFALEGAFQDAAEIAGVLLDLLQSQFLPAQSLARLVLTA
jgi:hypothetical protein